VKDSLYTNNSPAEFLKSKRYSVLKVTISKPTTLMKSINRSLEIDVCFASFTTFLKPAKLGINNLITCFTFNILHAL
jgi:hypothetical protein